MKKASAIYVLALALFGAGILGILKVGSGLAPGPAAAVESVPRAPVAPVSHSLGSALAENVRDPLSRLLLQFIVVVAATRTMGALFRKLGQPSVIGEIVAGILLGPSLLGWVLPGVSAFVFPSGSLPTLRLFSQIGVVVFMFVVGLDLDASHLGERAHTAVLVSHAGILVPYLLGTLAALVLFPLYAAPGTSFVSFALFMGIAMSITAFPVLARILSERGIARTPLGVMAITCAAVDDVTAWAILAVVVALARAAGLASTFFSLGLVVVFVLAMILLVRPALRRRLAAGGAEPGPEVMAKALLLMTACALATEVIGIHALFGAFLAGCVMPEDRGFREHLAVRLGNFSTVFLLPLFFAFSGLRTELSLLKDVPAVVATLAIVLVASAGKLGGCLLAARFTGLSWNESFQLGALMNTRGLVELIALNIGYDLGILPPRIFTMMVLMALVTTFMTGPLLSLAERRRAAALPASA